jgi:hypothetical protein
MLTTSLNKKINLKIYGKEETKVILEHVEAVCNEGKRANGITWVREIN